MACFRTETGTAGKACNCSSWGQQIASLVGSHKGMRPCRWRQGGWRRTGVRHGRRVLRMCRWVLMTSDKYSHDPTGAQHACGTLQQDCCHLRFRAWALRQPRAGEGEGGPGLPRKAQKINWLLYAGQKHAAYAVPLRPDVHSAPAPGASQISVWAPVRKLACSGQFRSKTES